MERLKLRRGLDETWSYVVAKKGIPEMNVHVCRKEGKVCMYACMYVDVTGYYY